MNRHSLLDRTSSPPVLAKLVGLKMVPVGDFFIVFPFALTSAVNYWIVQERWFKPQVSVKATLVIARRDAWVTQVVTCTPIWPAHWAQAREKSRHSTQLPRK